MFIEIISVLLADSLWTNMFVLENISILEKIVRPILIYFLLVLLFRLFGKRQLAELNPIDFIVLLVLSEAVQNGLVGEDNSVTGAFIAAFVLLFVNFIFAVVKYYSKPFETLVEGRPQVLIENSKIDKKSLKKEFMTEEDLDIIAYKEGLSDAGEIKKCVISPNGSFYVEGNTKTDEEKFRREVLNKLENLTLQLQELRENT